MGNGESKQIQKENETVQGFQAMLSNQDSLRLLNSTAISHPG